jgi:alpha-beta hydrolase superfamily lysophospholipase
VPVEHRLVTLTTEDGEINDALLVIDERAARRRARATGRRTACMHVHGIMGNFLVGTLRFLAPPLARDGFPVLIVETRMGNVGQLFGPGIFDLAPTDLDAGASWLREDGWDHLVGMGYSSGASLVTRWAATRHVPWLRGLALLGSPWGLPESLEMRSRRWGAEPTYEVLYERAREVMEAGDPQEADRLFVIERSRGPSREPRDSEVYTYRTWWHSRGPEADAAKTHLQIGQVRTPILMLQGTADSVVHPEEAHALAEVARAAGNRDVTLRFIEGADHFYKGREVVAIGALTRWLRKHA